MNLELKVFIYLAEAIILLIAIVWSDKHFINLFIKFVLFCVAIYGVVEIVKYVAR